MFAGDKEEEQEEDQGEEEREGFDILSYDDHRGPREKGINLWRFQIQPE